MAGLLGLFSRKHQAAVYNSGAQGFKVHGNSGATPTVKLAEGARHHLTLNANATLTITVPVPGLSYELLLALKQDGTGSRTVTWPESVIGEPTLTTTPNRTDLIKLVTFDGGTTWAVEFSKLDVTGLGAS